METTLAGEKGIANEEKSTWHTETLKIDLPGQTLGVLAGQCMKPFSILVSWLGLVFLLTPLFIFACNKTRSARNMLQAPRNTGTSATDNDTPSKKDLQPEPTQEENLRASDSLRDIREKQKKRESSEVKAATDTPKASSDSGTDIIVVPLGKAQTAVTHNNLTQANRKKRDRKASSKSGKVVTSQGKRKVRFSDTMSRSKESKSCKTAIQSAEKENTPEKSTSQKDT